MSSHEQAGRGPAPEQRAATTRATGVLDRARATLLDEPSSARDLREVADATLDVTAGHPSGQATLLASGRQTLSKLVRDADARVTALARLRRFRDVVGELDDRGLAAGHLVAGVVVMPGGTELPALLRSCRVAGVGDGDATIIVEGPVRLNPALVREMSRRTTGAVDLAARLAGLLRSTSANGGFDPYPLLDQLQASLPAVIGTVLRRRLLLAPVSLDGARVVADLDALRDVVPAHSPLAWVGEDWEAGPAELLDRVGADLPVAPGTAPDEAIVELLDRFVPNRLDSDQRRVLSAVLTGHSVAVDAPPGSGATTTAAAVAAVAAATGRRCLVVVPTRGEGDVLVDRLVRLGLGDLVSDGRGPLTSSDRSEVGSPEARAADARAADETRRHTQAGELYRGAVGELLRVRRPWQVRRADVLEALAAAELEGPRLTQVVLEQDPGTGLPKEQVDALADDLAEAVRLGAADPPVSAWTGARITDRQGAAEALRLARALREELIREARTAVGDLAHGTGTARAVTVAEIAQRFRLFSGLQATLDRLVPEVFDVAVLDLVAATADEEFRVTTGYTLAGPQRWRLRRRARALVRPGIDVDDAQLHRLLLAASAQRLEWQKISEGAGWAHLPAATGSMVAHLGALVRACERLDLLHPGLRLADKDLDGVHETVAALLADADALDDQPRRTLLVQRVIERGGGPLLQALLRLPPHTVTPEAAARELRLAWWLGVAAATAPATGARASTALAAEQYAASQQAWMDAAPARVRAAREALDPRLRLPDPIRVLVPADVADLPLDEHLDVVVLDDAGRASFPEVCGSLARTAQVLVLGDLGVARDGSAATVLGGCLPVDRLGRGHRTHDAHLAALAAAAGSSALSTTGAPAPSGTVTRTFLEDAVGLPSGENEQLDSTDVEVEHVVREALRLVADLAGQEPPRSVAVVTLTRSHASAIASGIRRAVRSYPALSEAFGSSREEPVVVAAVDQMRGLERDEVLLSTGFARTPHGRVIHRFAGLDSPGGAALLATAVSRARHRLHVVTALRSRDLDRSRLRSAGARALADVLEAVERAAAQPRRDAPVVETGAPLLTGRDSSVSAVLGVLARELHELGAGVAPGPGGGLRVRVDDRIVLVVDVDLEHPDQSVLAGRRAALTEAGWVHHLVAAELVAADPAGVALGLLGDSATTAADVPEPERKAEQSVEQPVEQQAEQESEQESQEQPDTAPEPAASAPANGRPVDVPVADTPVVPSVSADDTDRGWGDERASDDDERILRERPPHW